MNSRNISLTLGLFVVLLMAIMVITGCTQTAPVGYQPPTCNVGKQANMLCEWRDVGFLCGQTIINKGGHDPKNPPIGKDLYKVYSEFWCPSSGPAGSEWPWTGIILNCMPSRTRYLPAVICPHLCYDNMDTAIPPWTASCSPLPPRMVTSAGKASDLVLPFNSDDPDMLPGAEDFILGPFHITPVAQTT